MTRPDKIEEQLEEVRKIPAWAVATIVIGAASMLILLVIFGFVCGIFVQQYAHREDQKEERMNILMRAKSVASETELLDDVASQPVSNSKTKGKQRMARAEEEYQDMDL